MKIVVLAFLLLGTSAPSYAQKMNRTEYLAYLKNLSTNTTKLQDQIKVLNIDALKVDYARGKRLAEERDVVARNLEYLLKFISIQVVRDNLSDDINMSLGINDAVSTTQLLLSDLPGTETGLYWQETLGPLSLHLAEQDLTLRKHLFAYVEEVEAKAKKCSQ